MTPIDRNSLPPQVRKVLESLEASGATVHVARVEIPTSAAAEPTDPANQQPNSETSSPASDESESFVDTLVEIVRDGLQHLHNHLCPRIKENKQRIETLEREARNARRDIDELKLKVFELQGRLDQRNAKIG